MINVLFEYNGKPVKQGDHFGSQTEEGGLFTWGSTIHNLADSIQCPECKDSCHITILVSGSKAGISAKPVGRLCHVKYFKLVNAALPRSIKMPDDTNAE